MANTNKTKRKNIRIKNRIHRGKPEQFRMKVLIYLASRPEEEIISQTTAADDFESPLTTINYHFTALKKDGLIDERNKITEKGKKRLLHFKHWDKLYNKRLRAHKIQIVFNLLRVPSNFREIQSAIFKPFSNGRYNGMKGQIAGFTVMIYSPKKAVGIIPDIYANSDEEISATIMDCGNQLKESLETDFPGLVVDSFKPVRYTSMHIAVLDSIIAEQYMLKNNTCYSKDGITIDKSNDRYELETEHKRNHLHNIDFLKKYEDIEREQEMIRKLIFYFYSQKKGDKNESA